MRKLLGKDIHRFVLSDVRGRPARMRKNNIVIKGNKVTLFCSDCVAKGYFKK